MPKKYTIDQSFDHKHWKPLQIYLHTNSIWYTDGWKNPNDRNFRAHGVLNNSYTDSRLVWVCKSNLSKLTESNSVTLFWVHGQSNIRSKQLTPGLTRGEFKIY